MKEVEAVDKSRSLAVLPLYQGMYRSRDSSSLMGPVRIRHGIQTSMEAILTCHTSSIHRLTGLGGKNRVNYGVFALTPLFCLSPQYRPVSSNMSHGRPETCIKRLHCSMSQDLFHDGSFLVQGSTIGIALRLSNNNNNNNNNKNSRSLVFVPKGKMKKKRNTKKKRLTHPQISSLFFCFLLQEMVEYAMVLASNDTSIMAAPQSSIPHRGRVPSTKFTSEHIQWAHSINLDFVDFTDFWMS